MLTETLQVTRIVVARLDALNIPYFIGGSLASSLQGVARSTQDIDIVAEFDESQIEALVAAMEGDFYIDADMIGEALRHRSSFNILYLPTMFKVDIFLPEPKAWQREKWLRRQREEIYADDDSFAVYVASPEDTILQKLLWYRLTGERSDRQWGDVQGVLKVQGDALDFPYMEHWSQEIGVADLLTTAREEAG